MRTWEEQYIKNLFDALELLDEAGMLSSCEHERIIDTIRDLNDSLTQDGS